MKAIRNIDSLVDRLCSEDTNWQRTIYNVTGVILLENLHLYSNCGCIPLDQDMDTTEYCDINSIEDFISYIKQMESYAIYLIDVNYGKFTKSELFWGIYERILLQHENMKHNDGSESQEWGLYSISRYKDNVELHMALMACDLVDFDLSISSDTTLNDTLDMLVEMLNENCKYIDWLPSQKVFEVDYNVPYTYNDLKAKYSVLNF